MIKVLLIDDNPIDLLVNRRVVENIFNEVEIIQKRSAPEALEFLVSGEDPPDLILLDIKMPLMDGFDFLKNLKLKRSLPSKTRIFMVSSSIDPDDINRALSDEAVVDFLRKPLQINNVREHLISS